MIEVQQRGFMARTFRPMQKCTVCGFEGGINRVGWDFSSILILVILLCCLFVPGVIYGLWRGSKAGQLCCSRCKATIVIRF